MTSHVNFGEEPDCDLCLKTNECPNAWFADARVCPDYVVDDKYLAVLERFWADDHKYSQE